MNNSEFLTKYGATMDMNSLNAIKGVSVDFLKNHYRVADTIKGPEGREEFNEIFSDEINYHKDIINRCDNLIKML